MAEASLVITLRVNGNIGLVCRDGAFGNSMPTMGGCVVVVEGASGAAAAAIGSRLFVCRESGIVADNDFVAFEDLRLRIMDWIIRGMAKSRRSS